MYLKVLSYTFFRTCRIFSTTIFIPALANSQLLLQFNFNTTGRFSSKQDHRSRTRLLIQKPELTLKPWQNSRCQASHKFATSHNSKHVMSDDLSFQPSWRVAKKPLYSININH